MTRRMIAGLIVVGLGAGIWLLWPRVDSPGPTSTTQAVAVGTSSTSSDSGVSTTVGPPSSSTTSSTSHVVETVEEAEAILRELWFGWFEGIYNQDEDRIREVSATTEQADQGIRLFGVLDFISAPAADEILFLGLEILRNDEDCTALWAEADASAFRGSDAIGSGVWILRSVGDSWKLAGLWAHRDDLWEGDCDISLSQSSP